MSAFRCDRFRERDLLVVMASSVRTGYAAPFKKIPGCETACLFTGGVERVSCAKRSVVRRLNRRSCYPLTVTDHASRLVLLPETLEITHEYIAFSR